MAVLLAVLLGLAVSQPLHIIEIWSDEDLHEFSVTFKGFLRFLAVCDKDCPGTIELLMDTKFTMHDPPVIPGIVRDLTVLERSHIATDVNLLFYRLKANYPESVRGAVTFDILKGIMDDELRPVKALKSRLHAEKQKNADLTYVVGYFAKDSDLKATFFEVAEDNSGVCPFYTVPDAATAAEFDLTEPGVVVVRNKLLQGENDTPLLKMSHLESPEELEQEILESLFGFVGWITNTNYFLFRQEGKGLLTMFANLDSQLNPSMVKYYASRLRSLAKDYDQHITVTIADTEEFAQEVETFKIESPNFIMIDDTAEIYILKDIIMADGSFKAQEVRNFVEGYVSRSIKPYRVSEPVPEEPYDGRIRVLVGSQFDEFLETTDKDLLLVLVSPECDECLEVLQVLQEVAGIFEKTLTVCKIDSINNSLPRSYDPYDLPSLFLVRKGSSKGPVAYPTYDYNVQSLVEFIEAYY